MGSTVIEKETPINLSKYLVVDATYVNMSPITVKTVRRMQHE